MKRKSRIVLTLSMAFCICTSVVGCSGTKSIEDLSEDDFNQIVGGLDNSGHNSIVTTSAEEKEKPEIKATDEILAADIYSGKLQLGNAVFTFPALAGDLFSKGAVCVGEMDGETTVIQAHSRAVTAVEIDGVKYNVVFANISADRQLLKDCIVSPPTDSIIFPKGITVGTPVDELTKLWGEPNEKDIDIYKYAEDYIFYSDHYVSATGNTYTITIDLKTNTIKSIAYTLGSESDEMIEKSTKIGFSNKDFAYKIPEYLDDGIYAYEYDNKMYSLHYSNNVLGPESIKVSEYSDESIAAWMKGIDYKKDVEPSYTYKLNGDTAIIIERMNYGDYTKINLIHCSEDFKMYCMVFKVYPGYEDGTVPEGALTAVDSILFSIAETVEIQK